MRTWAAIGLALAAGNLGAVAILQGQGNASDSTPVYASAERLRPVGEMTKTVPALRLPVTMDLDDVTLDDALRRIAQKAGLGFTYGKSFPQLTRRVSLHAEGITVVEAFSTVLRGTGLDVLAWPSGHIVLVAAGSRDAGVAVRRQAGGSIAGRVVDAVTQAPLSQVAVRVEGPGLGAMTASDGRYTIRDVPAGTYHVIARRVGYVPFTKDATLTADQPATLDFGLSAVATKLNEVVTTAVGDQRRYEIGNAISTINADSIAPTAPITSLTDLISARAPGVEVLEIGGLAGSGEAIRIRGLSSLQLQNDPILIVDGVRQDNTAGGDIGALFSFRPPYGGDTGTHPSPARLNDLDFNDIASIDILKGPSASTEYGTDAANGVIVITTKRGDAGQPQWRVSAEQTASGIPGQFPKSYYSWGHTTDATHAPVNCTFAPALSYGSSAWSSGACVVDSVTEWNALNHKATSVFGTGMRGKYDVSVSGGSDAVRYFLAGALTNEGGLLRMPPVFRQVADTAKINLPGSAFDASVEQQRSVRANMAIRLGPAADVTAAASYVSTYQRNPDSDALVLGVYSGPALDDAAHYYGYYSFGAFYTPIASMTDIGSQNTNRVLTSVTANVRPTDWLVGHATAGIDHGSQLNMVLNYPINNPTYYDNPPFLGVANATTDEYSVDLRGAATVALTRAVRVVTSAGVQMVDTRIAGQRASTFGVTASNLTLSGAAGAVVGQIGNRQATLGGYGEEQVGFWDRLFVTGALRVDAGSGFGSAIATTAYPKGSVSWLAVNGGATTVRVRGAFGESGVQPLNGAALTLYQAGVGYVNGGTATTYLLSWPGNTHLHPERSAEFEGGVDVTGWANRVTVELTAYSKLTRDALVNVDLGPSLGSLAYQENIGRVRNSGMEVAATAEILQRPSLSWDVGVNASVNHNKLLSLPPGSNIQQLPGNSNGQLQVPGYPLYGIWLPRVTYADANHDGLIEPSEITVASAATYVGPSVPTQEASVSTHLAFWRGAVTIGGLVDYRAGYRVPNLNALEQDAAGNSRTMNFPHGPAWLQARAVEDGVFQFNALDAENGAFARVREVSLTYAFPRQITRALRLASLGMTGAVRNLALWTRYTGIDPEGNVGQGATLQPNPVSGGFYVNNDVRSDQGAVPLLRYWVLRLNAGL